MPAGEQREQMNSEPLLGAADEAVASTAEQQKRAESIELAARLDREREDFEVQQRQRRAAKAAAAAGSTQPPLPIWWLLFIVFYFFPIVCTWSVLGSILLPADIAELVDADEKASILGAVSGFGAAMQFAQPVVGAVSDRLRPKACGRIFGRRRGFTVFGQIASCAALLMMLWVKPVATALHLPEVAVLAAGYTGYMLGNAVSYAPYLSILPEVALATAETVVLLAPPLANAVLAAASICTGETAPADRPFSRLAAGRPSVAAGPVLGSDLVRDTLRDVRLSR